MLFGKKFLKNTAYTILFSMFISLFITACSKQSSIELSGTIESTQIDINSEVMGKVVSIDKEEGQVLKKGDIVASVDSSIQNLTVKQQEEIYNMKKSRLDELKAGSREEQIKQSESAVKQAKAKLDEIKAGTRPEQLRQAEANVSSAKSAVNNADNAVESAQINYDYWKKKYNDIKAQVESVSVSNNDLVDAKYKLDTAKKQLDTAKEQYESINGQLKATTAQYDLLKNGATKQSIDAAAANYQQAVASLDLVKKGATSQAIEAAEADLNQSARQVDQAKTVLDKYSVKTPIDGTFIIKNINIGDIINSGTNIGSVSNLSDLWVPFYVPQRYLNSISLNSETDLKTSALDDKAVKGKIIYISSTAEFTPKNTETTESKENTVYKIKVKILDNISLLKPGMTVNMQIPIK